MKTRQQLEAELSCFAKRLAQLSKDLQPHYGNQRNVMAYVEGAENYLRIALENIK
jgi:hypothetical protein